MKGKWRDKSYENGRKRKMREAIQRTGDSVKEWIADRRIDEKLRREMLRRKEPGIDRMCAATRRGESYDCEEQTSDLKDASGGKEREKEAERHRPPSETHLISVSATGMR